LRQEKEKLETRTKKLTCPFCKRERDAKIVNFLGGRYFADPISSIVKAVKIDEDLGKFLQAALPCECGASWYVGGGEIPKQHAAVKLSEEIVAVKQYVTINEVELKGKKKGKMYRWKQMQLRIPRVFQTVRPGRYTIFHEGDDIILRPAKDGS
jgi:hypothetical protein